MLEGEDRHTHVPAVYSKQPDNECAYSCHWTGLLGIAWMAHRGYIGTGALTPGLFVVGLEVVEFLQAAHLTPATLVPFALSLWLPGSGLFALGLFSLVTNGRNETQSINV